MTKSELKTGMIVTLRDGRKMQVFIDTVTYTRLRGCNFITNGREWVPLEQYNEDLTYAKDDRKDIVMVQYVSTVFDMGLETDKVTIDGTLWKRLDTKKMTVSEIEAILGYKVEIVSEEN